MKSIPASSTLPVIQAPVALESLVHYSNGFENDMARLRCDLRTIETPVDASKPEVFVEVIMAHNNQEEDARHDSASSPVCSRNTEPSMSRTLCEAQFLLNELREPSLQRIGSGSFMRRNRNGPARTETSQTAATDKAPMLGISTVDVRKDTGRSSGVDHPITPAGPLTPPAEDSRSTHAERQVIQGPSHNIAEQAWFLEIVRHEEQRSRRLEGESIVMQMDIVEPVSRTNTCRFIIALGLLNISSSLAVGLTWSILKDDVSGGFTVAGCLITAGIAMLALWQSYHSKQCKCFEVDRQE